MMNDSNYSIEQLNSTTRKLTSILNRLKFQRDESGLVFNAQELLSLLDEDQILIKIKTDFLNNAPSIALDTWLEVNRSKSSFAGAGFFKLPKNKNERFSLLYQLIERIEEQGPRFLLVKMVGWTGKTKVALMIPDIVIFFIIPFITLLNMPLEDMRVKAESASKPAFNYYNNSVHNETKDNHAPVTVTTIQINSDQKYEIINTLKQALSKVDEIENEDQRELASEYLEQTLDEVEAGNIKPEKIEKRKKFFEKHKVDWIGLSGLTLGAIQVIQGWL